MTTTPPPPGSMPPPGPYGNGYAHQGYGSDASHGFEIASAATNPWNYNQIDGKTLNPAYASPWNPTGVSQYGPSYNGRVETPELSATLQQNSGAGGYGVPPGGVSRQGVSTTLNQLGITEPAANMEATNAIMAQFGGSPYAPFAGPGSADAIAGFLMGGQPSLDTNALAASVNTALGPSGALAGGYSPTPGAPPTYPGAPPYAPPSPYMPPYSPYPYGGYPYAPYPFPPPFYPPPPPAPPGSPNPPSTPPIR